MSKQKTSNTPSNPSTDAPSDTGPLREEVRALERTRNLQRQRYESLLGISSILSSTLSLPRLLDVILNATIQLTDTAAASILLIDQHTGNLYFEATSNMRTEEVERIEVPLDGSIAGWVVKHGKPKIIQDVKHDKQFTVSAQVDSVTTFSTDSLLAVPLIAKGKMIGVLEALNKNDQQPFVDEDVETLTALAGQAAVAIENARLFQQSDLISEMVHELRTPLMALVSLSELLSRPNLSQEQREEFASTIQSEAKRLTEMTSSFLELSRLESGRAYIKSKPVDLATVIEETVTVQGPQAAERQISILTNVPEDLPTIPGDFDRLKQVMLNLVSNAIKYNKLAGSIVISAQEKNDEVQVCVQDSGRGIPEQAMEKLFSRFYRVPDSEGYTTGTGLGLSICQRIIQQHNGRIWVESELGKGSSFFFVIPLQQVETTSPLRLDQDL